MIEVVKYTADKKKEWDEFVDSADNSSFLFFRDYMEYHSDRFEDFSLMLYEKSKLKALLPGNIKNSDFYSHQGLTFGGIVYTSKFTFANSLNYLNSFIAFLHKHHLNHFFFKLQPFFYSKTLQQVIQFHMETNLKVSQQFDIGAYIYLPSHTFPSKCVRKGKLEDYEYSFSNDFGGFWNMLQGNLLSVHDAKPVHTLNEIESLRNKFPENIKLLVLKYRDTDELHAGAVLYAYNNIVKVQYFATSPSGRKNRASDVLYYHIINLHKNSHTFIDFGTNMDRTGIVNFSLLDTKEKFGAKELPIKTYKLKLNEEINI